MKRLIPAILVSVILVLSLSSVAFAADNPKKPITPPELKSITFVHYAKPDVPPGLAKKDEPELPEPDNSAYSLLGISLPGTFSYYINPSGAPAGSVSEINESFETWDVETSAELFNYEGQTPKYMGYDEQNTVSWMKIASPA